MGKKIEIKKGDIYGRLTIIEEIPGSSRKIPRKVLCRCICGVKKIFVLGELRRGKSTSCGCFQKENVRKQQLTHGMKGTEIYESWHSMKQRCLNQNHKSFKDYGGREIKICDRWLNSFENFYKDMGDRPKKMTIDRIDNNGNYCKENCRWATTKEQAKNRRNTVLIKYKGQTMCQSDWGRKTGLGIDVICRRIKNGYTKEEAVSLPLFTRRKLLNK